MRRSTDDQSLASFIEYAPELELADRSTIENYGTCPAMAAAVRDGLVNNNSGAATGGEEIHKAFGAAVTAYLNADPQSYSIPNDIADEMASVLRSSRPDVQPDVMESARYTCWPWAKFITGLHPENILRYDGGEGARSGQLSYPMEGLGITLTSELDFLMSTDSPVVLKEIDYKTGWKKYGIDEIAKRFQFIVHAVLVLFNYPEIEALQIAVWEPRRGGMSYPVLFPRKRLDEYETLVRNVAGQFVQYRKTPFAECPTWPAEEKCSICPAAAICPAAGHPAVDVASDAPGYLLQLYAIQQRADAMEKSLWAHREKTGQDIIAEGGICFGRDKPKKEVKPPKPLYTLKETKEPKAE